jgi:beta-mannosidase
VAELRAGWEVTSSASGAWERPQDIIGATWVEARVPGTAAAAVGPGERDFDDEDWFFRTRFSAVEIASGDSGRDASEPAPGAGRFLLEFDGIATVSQVFLNGELILESASMWATHAVDVTERLLPDNELVIACRALSPLMAVAKRPRQRWRTRLVHEGNLRWYRAMIFGRSPGYAPSPAPVGPWRPVRLVRKPTSGIEELRVVTRLEGEDGVVAIRARTYGGFADAEAAIGEATAELTPDGDGWLQGEVRLAGVEPWWPHTHGKPRLYELAIELDGTEAARRRVGFRSLSFAQDIAEDGLDLHVNGVPVFARGAVWTPMDLISLAPADADLRRVLERARDAGMNMLRIVGTGAYESPQFFDLCDELGIMVWQDLMFASLDYPISDPEFRAEVEREARQVLLAVSGRPSLTVLCASHELEQQPAMLGLDPALGRDELWEETLPAVVSEYGTDCAYLRSTPIGGDVPFHANRGIAHYFGVGGYFRPLSDVRHTGVRFAAECLPFANVPDSVELPTHHPEWKAGVQRDAGPAFQLAPGFDFDDVRDFYMAQLFDVDPVKLRRNDQDRYFELSRATSGEAMAEVMGEWRRAGSPCRGALMLWMKDMVPGAGFGILDHRGLPKVAYHHLRRALAPVAVWTTDESVSGITLHVANDRGERLRARLRLALYHDLHNRVADAEELIEIEPHGHLERTVEGMLGRFVDSALTFGFGPPAHDAIVASLESVDEPGMLISQAMRFPAGRPLGRDSGERTGVRAAARQDADGSVSIAIDCERLLYGAFLDIPGYEPEDNAFSVEPAISRVIRARPVSAGSNFVGGSLKALNLSDTVAIEPPPVDVPSDEHREHVFVADA